MLVWGDGKHGLVAKDNPKIPYGLLIGTPKGEEPEPLDDAQVRDLRDLLTDWLQRIGRDW